MDEDIQSILNEVQLSDVDLKYDHIHQPIFPLLLNRNKDIRDAGRAFLSTLYDPEKFEASRNTLISNLPTSLTVSLPEYKQMMEVIHDPKTNAFSFIEQAATIPDKTLDEMHTKRQFRRHALNTLKSIAKATAVAGAAVVAGQSVYSWATETPSLNGTVPYGTFYNPVDVRDQMFATKGVPEEYKSFVKGQELVRDDPRWLQYYSLEQNRFYQPSFMFLSDPKVASSSFGSKSSPGSSLLPSSSELLIPDESMKSSFFMKNVFNTARDAFWDELLQSIHDYKTLSYLNSLTSQDQRHVEQMRELTSDLKNNVYKKSAYFVGYNLGYRLLDFIGPAFINRGLNAAGIINENQMRMIDQNLQAPRAWLRTWVVPFGTALWEAWNAGQDYLNPQVSIQERQKLYKKYGEKFDAMIDQFMIMNRLDVQLSWPQRIKAWFGMQAGDTKRYEIVQKIKLPRFTNDVELGLAELYFYLASRRNLFNTDSGMDRAIAWGTFFLPVEERKEFVGQLKIHDSFSYQDPDRLLPSHFGWGSHVDYSKAYEQAYTFFRSDQFKDAYLGTGYLANVEEMKWERSSLLDAIDQLHELAVGGEKDEFVKTFDQFTQRLIDSTSMVAEALMAQKFKGSRAEMKRILEKINVRPFAQ